MAANLRETLHRTMIPNSGFPREFVFTFIRQQLQVLLQQQALLQRPPMRPQTTTWTPAPASAPPGIRPPAMSTMPTQEQRNQVLSLLAAMNKTKTSSAK